MKKNLFAASLVIKKEDNLEDLTLKQFIDYSYKQKFLPNQVLQLLSNRANYSKNLSKADYVNIDGRLYY